MDKIALWVICLKRQVLHSIRVSHLTYILRSNSFSSRANPYSPCIEADPDGEK